MAREHEHLALIPDLPRAEHEELRAARWQAALEQAMRAQGRSMTDAAQSPKSAAWKIAIARPLKNTVAPPYRRLAQSLAMGSPASVRAYMWSAGWSSGNASKPADATSPGRV